MGGKSKPAVPEKPGRAGKVLRCAKRNSPSPKENEGALARRSSRWANKRSALAQRKWGPALLPAPTAPSEGYAGVRGPGQNPKAPTRSRSWLTSSGVASYRTAPSCEEPTVYQTARPEGSLVLRPVRPGLLDPKSLEAKTVRCSTALLGSITLASRFAHPISEETSGNRVALEEDQLFRRLFPAGPRKTRKLFSLPAGGDRTFGHLPRLPAVAGSLERPGPPSRSPNDNARLGRVAKAKNGVEACG